jgi:hypothetical protein
MALTRSLSNASIYKRLQGDPEDIEWKPFPAFPPSEMKSDLSDREVIDHQVERIIVHPKSIDIELREATSVVGPNGNAASSATGACADADPATSSTGALVIRLPWRAAAFPSVKGVLHQPEAKPTLKAETREPADCNAIIDHS